MKRLHRASQLATSALATLCLTGCCTHYVSQIGYSEARLTQKRVFSNAAGDLVVEAELTRNPLNSRNNTRSLGKRYVYLFGSDARQEIADTAGRGQVLHRQGTNYIQIGHSNFNPQYAGRWNYAPPDVLHHVDAPELPIGIGQPLQEYSARQIWHGKAWKQSELTYTVNGTSYVVEVSIDASGIWFPEAYHQAKWGYPLRILYIPAIAVDVVTSPFQFIWFVNEFSKWGDGSGVR